MHASGRPWLVGWWSDEEITVAAAGDTRLAVIGVCPFDTQRLVREAERLRDLTDLDRLACTMPGSFHLVASLGGQVRVQGSASGLRLVFHTRLGGVTVAADRADLLGELSNASVDERQVAVRLLSLVPHPLALTPLWRGVQAVEPGHCLMIEADGRSHQRRWWTPPIPERSLAAGATALREALVSAVNVRSGGGGTVSCDLSGGMDSTTMCFLAARGPAKVIASTMPTVDPADDDETWARRAAAHLPEVEHLVSPVEDLPAAQYTTRLDDLLDEPTLAMVGRPTLVYRLPSLHAAGSRLHLTGAGGDHVTWCSPAHYHRLLRHRPRFALRQLRGFRALHHWPWGETLRALADSRPYRRWLSDAADDLRQPPPNLGNTLTWGFPPRLATWATGTAAQAVREVFAEAAATAEPLAADRGQHADLANLRHGTRLIRQWDQMSARAGLPMSSPFFDDRVVEACLAVRPEERVTPWRYRPLLVAAMRGIMPEECLGRSTKAVGSTEAARTIRNQRTEILELWDGSRLAQMGLVDEDRLRAAVDPSAPEAHRELLEETMACEMWLQTIAAHGRMPVTTG